MSYDIGDTVGLATTFKNDAAVVTDPTTVTLKIRRPSRVETTHIYPTDPNVVKDAVGQYHYDLYLNAAGKWLIRWIGTGAVSTATEETIEVNESGFDDPL